MNYTSGTRISYLQRKKYGQLIESWKRKNPKNSTKTLKDIEVELCKLNSKSCNHNNFLLYINKKIEYDTKVKTEYDTTYLRKLRWFGYLNKMKHENELLNQISNAFGDNIKIIMGDWSAKGCIKFTPVPNIGLKRKLAQRFDVYSIDEYNTSIIHNKYHVKCKHLKVKNNDFIENTNPQIIENELNKDELKERDLKPIFKYKSLHAVLTYTNVEQKMGCDLIDQGCINRDKNSVLNMETIFRNLLDCGKRPEIFSRSNNHSDSRVNPNDAKGTNRKVSKRNSKNTPKNVLKKVRLDK
jgi:hypothetical protein